MGKARRILQRGSVEIDGALSVNGSSLEGLINTVNTTAETMAVAKAVSEGATAQTMQEVSDITSDDCITPKEKISLKRQVDDIDEEYATIYQMAVDAGLADAAAEYQDAYKAVKELCYGNIYAPPSPYDVANPLFASMGDKSEWSGLGFQVYTAFSRYSTARLAASTPTVAQAANYRYETLYIRAVEQPTTPTVRSPAGWSTTVPEGVATVWFIGATIGYNDELRSAWSSPARFSSAASAIAQLTNDEATVFVAGDGTLNFSGVETKIQVYEAGVETTSYYTYGAQPSAGVTGTLTGNRYVVTGLTTDTGYVDIVADRSGMSTMTKRFRVKKMQTTTQEIVSLQKSTSALIFKSNGSCYPEIISLSAFKTAGNSASGPYAGLFKVFINDVLVKTHSGESVTIDPYLYYPFPSDKVFPSDERIPIDDLGDKDVATMTVEIWTADGTVRLEHESITILKDVGVTLADIIAANPSKISGALPKYLGKFLAKLPDEYHAGDWFLIYDTDDAPYQRGVYYTNDNGTITRMEGDATESNYFVFALSDILAVTQAGYGDLEDYGSVTFIPNLAANTIFTQALKIGVGQITGAGALASLNQIEAAQLGATIIQGGYIRADLIDVDTLMGQHGIFRGSLESGPLELTISPPVTAWFTITGKLESAFIDELIASGILGGAYVCTGEYNSSVITYINFSRTKRTTTETTSTVHYADLQYYEKSDSYGVYETGWKYHDGLNIWHRDTVYYDYAIKIYNNETLIIDLTATKNDVASWLLYEQTGSGIGTWKYFKDVDTKPTEPSGPTGTVAAADSSTVLSTGTVSFTADAFTMKLKNLPAYSSSLPSWTAYLEEDSSGNYMLKVKK